MNKLVQLITLKLFQWIFTKHCHQAKYLHKVNNRNTRTKFKIKPLNVNPTKWSNIRKQFIDDELFECVWQFCGVGA